MTAKPSAAASIAAANASAHGRAAPSACSAPQPATTPGTVIVSGPVAGIARPRVRWSAALTPRAAGPLALTATGARPGRRTTANRSPPGLQLCG